VTKLYNCKYIITLVISFKAPATGRDIKTSTVCFSLLEKGRQILMKDNLIDEEKAKQEEAAQETIEQKIDRLGKHQHIEGKGWGEGWE
jgi:hypothetical protein